jgi:hypothetical protein
MQSPPFTPPPPQQAGGIPSKEVIQGVNYPEGASAHAHQSFYQTLQKMSNEDPRILASYIKKYATQIATQDPTIATQLLNIVKHINRS